MSDRLDLSVAAAPESVRELEGAVEGFGAERGWPLDVIFQMQLVVEELATNIVRVAGAGDCIDLSVRSSDDEILVEMVDRGPAFNPLTDAPEPDLDSPLEDRPIGGLGLHLVREAVDEIRYARDGGANRLTMVKRRGG